jgi:hypothetical protein
VLKYDRARFVAGAVEDERERLTTGQEPRQLGLARLDRLVAQIAAVELQEIERAIDRRIVTLVPAKKLEVREAVRVACDQLAVGDAGAHRNRLDGGDDRRKAPSPIERVRVRPAKARRAGGRASRATWAVFIRPGGTQQAARLRPTCELGQSNERPGDHRWTAKTLTNL